MFTVIINTPAGAQECITERHIMGAMTQRAAHLHHVKGSTVRIEDAEEVEDYRFKGVLIHGTADPAEYADRIEAENTAAYYESLEALR